MSLATGPRLGAARPDAGGARPPKLAERLLDGAGYAWLRLGVDAAMLCCAMAAAIVGARAAGTSMHAEAALWFLPPVVIAVMYARGMYRRRMRPVILDGVLPLLGAVSIAAMAVLTAVTLLAPGAHPGMLVARAWLFAVVFVGAGRVALAVAQRRARRRGVLGRPTLIVGAGRMGAQVAQRLHDHPEYGLRPVGFLDADPPDDIDGLERQVPVLGAPDELPEVADATGARHVILAFSRAPDRGLVPLVRQCEELGLEVALVPRLFESINERMALEHLGGVPLLQLRAVDPQSWQFAIKHALDRVAAATMLLVLAPLLLALAAAVKLSSSGPALFRQRRIGRDGTEFDMFKFRTMVAPRDGRWGEDEEYAPPVGQAPGGVEGEDRRTRLGAWMRRTSVDELPQLINVLRGDMSIVGPRPERPIYAEAFAQSVYRYADRHRVKSGITGWAQVHGLRGQTSLADRVEWDNHYIANWSLALDCKVLLLTLRAVVQGAE
jgi:exopolysaccharide biosynthesis polyprenyl glycosylphosphotransferase